MKTVILKPNVVVMFHAIYIFYIDLYKILVLRAQKELELHLWGGFQMILIFYDKYFLRVFCGGRTSICGGRRILMIFNKFQDFGKIIKIKNILRPPQIDIRPPQKTLKKYFS